MQYMCTLYIVFEVNCAVALKYIQFLPIVVFCKTGVCTLHYNCDLCVIMHCNSLYY